MTATERYNQAFLRVRAAEHALYHARGEALAELLAMNEELRAERAPDND